MIAKDQHIAKLEWHINELNQKLDEAKEVVNEVYAIGFNKVVQQANHFFADKILNFDLINLTKDMNEIKGGQAIELNQV